jgi:hypothetical protein
MSTMRSAFEKAGMFKNEMNAVDEKDRIAKEEKERLEQEDREKRLQESKNRIKYENEMVEFSEKISNLQYMSGDKGRNFLFHLICSHIPFTKTRPVNRIKDKNKKAKCCICNSEILSLEEIVELFGTGDFMLEYLRLQLSEDFQNMAEEERASLLEKHRNKVVGGKKIGLTSDETSTIICAPCLHKFREWITRQILNNNGLVRKAIRKTTGVQ